MANRDDLQYLDMSKTELKKQGRITVENEVAEELIDAHGEPGVRKPHGATHTVLDFSVKKVEPEEPENEEEEEPPPPAE